MSSTMHKSSCSVAHVSRKKIATIRRKIVDGLVYSRTGNISGWIARFILDLLNRFDRGGLKTFDLELGYRAK